MLEQRSQIETQIAIFIKPGANLVKLPIQYHNPKEINFIYQSSTLNV